MSLLTTMPDRTFEFSSAVIEEFRRLRPADEAEQLLWIELLKTGRSLATNAAESGGAHSRKDFILKFQIALKEARESFQLLRLLKRHCPNRQDELNTLLRQCDQIIAVLVTSLKTAKRNDAVQKTVRSPRPDES